MGYGDRLAVRPGEKIAFKVSLESGEDRYCAHIVRLICGDDRPEGPGFASRRSTLPSTGSMRGGGDVDCGSCLVPGDAALAARGASPWRRSSGRRRRGADHSGWRRLPPASTRRLTHSTAGVFRERRSTRRWYRVLARLDAGGPDPLRALNRILGDRRTCRQATSQGGQPAGQPSFAPSQRSPARHFNGKIEAPCLAAELSVPPIGGALASTRFPAAGRWDWRDRDELPGCRVTASTAAPSSPARGVTGHLWAGAA
jgi:hypothetical protein